MRKSREKGERGKNPSGLTAVNPEKMTLLSLPSKGFIRRTLFQQARGMATQMVTIREALNMAIDEEMEADEVRRPW